MEHTIYYFSATGNSLHVARTLAGKLGPCQLVSLSGLTELPQVTVAADVVGLVFPTHYFGLPPLVRSFVERLVLEKPVYTFAAVTSGSNRHFSSALVQLAALFQQKGQHLDAGFHVDMISSYLPLSALPPEPKLQARLIRADRQLERIAAAIQKREPVMEAEHFWPVFAAINHYWRKQLLPQSYRKFYTTGTCSSCGSCATLCPVRNIRMQHGKPVWQEQCQECLACLHGCPSQSIEFGARTAGKKRYRHPAVTAAELMAAKSGAARSSQNTEQSEPSYES
jgi:ferredoxin